ncbi:MAG: glycosyltransferase family 4 protein, partial [Candidatus Aenigmatarchaeota archaeon]
MKIAIVIMQCSKNRSSRYVNEVTRRFADAGHEVHVFTNSWDELDGRVKVHKVPSLSLGFSIKEFVFTVLASLMMKFHKFDVTMAQATRYFRPDVCYMQFVYKEWANFKRRNRLPLNFADKYLSWMERRNVRKAERIIAMSEVIKNEIMHNHEVCAEKIDVIYSGVD